MPKTKKPPVDIAVFEAALPAFQEQRARYKQRLKDWWLARNIVQAVSDLNDHEYLHAEFFSGCMFVEHYLGWRADMEKSSKPEHKELCNLRCKILYQPRFSFWAFWRLRHNEFNELWWNIYRERYESLSALLTPQQQSATATLEYCEDLGAYTKRAELQEELYHHLLRYDILRSTKIKRA